MRTIIWNMVKKIFKKEIEEEVKIGISDASKAIIKRTKLGRGYATKNQRNPLNKKSC